MMHHRMPRSSVLPGLRRLAWLSIACALTAQCSIAQEAPPSLTWRGDYARALEEARATNRLLWIQFTGPWCPSCHRMERETFTDPDVVRRADQAFIPLKLRSDVHEQLALSFELSSLPATILVTPNREVLAIHQGFLDASEMDGVLAGAIQKRPGSKPVTQTQIASSAKTGTQPKTKADKPKTETQVELSGYCPVSLISNRKLVQGQAEYTIQHDGRVYRFANTLMVSLFRKDPERYVPVNGGRCAVAQTDRGKVQAGDPKWGVLYDGRLFLCATEPDRKLFLSNPDRYATVDIAEKGFCPHCLGESGLLVRGDPRYNATRAGQRYWFPDPTHRDAFLASAETEGTARR